MQRAIQRLIPPLFQPADQVEPDDPWLGVRLEHVYRFREVTLDAAPLPAVSASAMSSDYHISRRNSGP